MKSAIELFEEKIVNTLDKFKDRETDEEISVQEKAKLETGMGADILRWARQGLIKIDDKAFEEKFKEKMEIIRHL